MSDNPVVSDSRLEEVITGKPRKSARRAVFLVVSICLVSVAAFVFMIAAALGKINTKNLGSGSPLLRLPSIKAGQLAGEGDGRINVALLGIGGAKHPGGQLTDTIIVASVDPKNKEAAFLSVPRDLYVKYPKPLSGAGKINNVHAYGEQQKVPGGGPELTKKALSELLDLPIHYYIRADFDGFRQLVDALGGITFNVEKDLYDPLFPAPNLIDYEPFSIKAGIQKLDGKTALKYARSRETTSDFDRAARQQAVLVAIKEKAVSAKIVANPAKIFEIANIIGNHIRTDLTVKEIERLVELSKDIPRDKIITKVLDNGPGGPLVSESTEQGYFLKLRDPTGQEVKQIAHNIFKDPYISSEAAAIEIRNASSSTGAGGKLSQELSALGYRVVNIVKSDAKVASTQVIDFSAGTKPFTLQYLANRLKVKSSTSSLSSEADIVIIIGEDYVETSNSKSN